MQISVVTACYNSAPTLEDAINSVVSQHYSDIEHIVIDGASSDATRSILAARPQQQLRWYSEPDEGIYDALNKGIARAQGDVVGFLHADDVLSMVAQCFTDSSVMACYGDLMYVSQHDTSRVIRYWRSGAYHPKLLKSGWMPPHPTLYVRREVYEKIGGFNTTYRIAADYDCILRLFRYIEKQGGRVEYLPSVLVNMRTGGASNRSLKNIIQKSREDLRSLRSNKVGGLGVLAKKNFYKLGQFFKRVSG
jgi:glycosyltransferase involved in cell wall biosynthesis